MTATIRELRREGAASLMGASTSPQLDSELLLACVLASPREALVAHDENRVSPRAQNRYRRLLAERRRGVPLPYLMGTKEFFGRPFVVTPAVLVPRPETEAVAVEALRLLHTPSSSRHPVVADIGTGSGVLAVTITRERPSVRLVAVDRSAPALAVARRNARKHRVLKRIVFLESDLLQKIPDDLTPDIIVANLPYIPSDHLRHAGAHPDTRGLLFEPFRALDGGPDGLYVLRRFFAQLKRMAHIRDHVQHLILEHSTPQRRRILEIAHDALPEFQPYIVSPFVTRWTRRA